MTTVWGYMVTRRGFCVSITEVERRAMEVAIKDHRTLITHAKLIGTDDPNILFEGIDASFVAWRVTFKVDRNNSDRLYRVNHSGQCVVEYENVVSRRLETMNEHFMSPYHKDTNELGFATND